MIKEVHFRIRFSDGREFGPESMDTIAVWAREGHIPRDALLVADDGGTVRSVLSVPTLGTILQAPPTVPTGVPPLAGEAPLSGMIPYTNPPALIGYYLGVFSLVPLFGMATAIPAVILGIAGLIKRAREPKVRGLAHAVVAIVLGVVGPLVWLVIFVLLVNQR